MYPEIEETVNFIARFLLNKIPCRKICLFSEQLANFLLLKYEGHWQIEKPHKESSFRSLRIKVGGMSDPLLSVAAKAVGIDAEELLNLIASELTVWVNPGEVSYKVGECGQIWQLYAPGTRTVAKVAGPDGDCSKVVELKLGMRNSTSCNWLTGASHLFELASPNECKFTVGRFAVTRFGTAKQKTDLTMLRNIQRKAALKAVTTNANMSTSISPDSFPSQIHAGALFCQDAFSAT